MGLFDNLFKKSNSVTANRSSQDKKISLLHSHIYL